MTLATATTFATVYRTIGLTLFALVAVGAILYVLVNVLFAGKAELGSEIELAANRKPYYPDEVLEGPKLDRTLTVALLFLAVLAVGIPYYWVMEPARQENAADGFGNRFAHRGELLFATTGDNPRALNCAGCHGGLDGGVVQDFIRTDAEGNVSVVDWRAPSLGSVLLRFSREEVTFILTYGRPGTPMPAWGVEGGGPLNEQQVQNLIDYLDENTFDPAEVQAAAEEQLALYMDADFEDGTPVFGSEGEAMFNLGLLDNFAGGAYACARCHTTDWSFAEVESETDDDDGNFVVDRESYEAATENSGCGGAYGPSLCDGAVDRQFPDPEDHVEFVTAGSEFGIGYGTSGQGDGTMPGFGLRPAEPGEFWIERNADREPTAGMLTPELIDAVVDYERQLTSDGSGS